MEIATATLRSYDPEIRKARADKARRSTTIEDAVALYISDMQTRLGDNGTVAMAKSLFGDVDPETKAVKRKGRLFESLHCLASGQPSQVADFTPAHLTAWRSSWKFKSDLTAANRWSMVKSFFNFCERQGWISDSPARKLRGLPTAKGSRTAIFTDQQYANIVAAVALYDPAPMGARTSRTTKCNAEVGWSFSAYRPRST